MIDASKITYRPHHSHNLACDILHYQVDIDTSITYCIYVQQVKSKFISSKVDQGLEIMEFYRGENYNVGSQLSSYSKIYEVSKGNYEFIGHNIPYQYRHIWLELRKLYLTMSPLSDLIV